MLLKIVYGIGQHVYFTDVTRVRFVAHHAADAIPVDLDKVVFEGLVVYSDGFLMDQVGCSPEGDSNKSYFLNKIVIETKESPEPELVYFTGTAYLCDDKGNTVDTLR